MWMGQFELLHFFGWHWTVKLKLFGMFIATVSSAFLGFGSWKYRPQLIAEGFSELPDDSYSEF